MKILNDSGYITHVAIPKTEIKEIRFLKDSKMKLSQWYAKYKPDIIINGTLYDYSTGKPVESYISNGQVLSTSDWCRKGVGINYDNTIQFGEVNNNYRDFMVGFPVLIDNSKPSVNFEVAKDIKATNPRSVFSVNNGEVLLTTVDGRQTGKIGMTIDKLVQYMSGMGVTHSINLDGGGSTHLMINGKTVNSPCEDRAVSNIIAIWLNPTDVKEGNNIKRKIFLDAGHGGKDGGASNGTLLEKNMNLVTALACKEALISYGFDVKMARETDVFLELTDRTTLANTWGADLFLSIHYNAGGGDRGEVIYSVYGGVGKDVAQVVKQEMITLGQSVVKDYSKASTSGNGNYFTIIQSSKMPALILEGCFIDNATDRQIADTIPEQQAIGVAYAKAIAKYYGVSIPSTATQPVSNNKYSYDNTVENMIRLGVIKKENMADWEKVLLPNKSVPSEYARTVLNSLIALIK